MVDDHDDLEAGGEGLEAGGQKLNLLPFQERVSANAAAMTANMAFFISREFFCH